MKYHLYAFLIGFVLDLVLGDPKFLYNPTKLIRKLVRSLEKKYLGERPEKNDKFEEPVEFVKAPPLIGAPKQPKENLDEDRKTARKNGRSMVAIVLVLVYLVVTIIYFIPYYFNMKAGMVVEAILTYFCLAGKNLMTESLKVEDALDDNDLIGARTQLSNLSRRDTDKLGEVGIIRATVEHVAENTNDHVVAPMFYLSLGGPILGFLYKAINIMDEEVGYKNSRYRDFGRAAATMDDAAGFFPGRVAAWLMIVAAFFGGKKLSSKRAVTFYKRDRFNSASSNSGMTTSACAGAIGIKLFGDVKYFGQVNKRPYVGDDIKTPEASDISLSTRLMLLTSILATAMSAGIIWAVWSAVMTFMVK